MVHEMSVYDVEMKPVGTRFFYPCALRTKMGEIRCQNWGSNDYRFIVHRGDFRGCHFPGV